MLFRKRNVNNKTKKVKKLETNVMTHLPKKKKEREKKKFYTPEYIQEIHTREPSVTPQAIKEEVICSFFMLLVIPSFS